MLLYKVTTGHLIALTILSSSDEIILEGRVGVLGYGNFSRHVQWFLNWLLHHGDRVEQGVKVVAAALWLHMQ